jgi:RimJ/RimL family protein N-acetyltransferase/glycosyltransferase involved in cell wall biosynthesis
MGKRHLPPLEAGRVRLRLLAEPDLPRTLAWRNQDHIRRWFFSSERLTLQEHAGWFARYQQRDDDFVFIIEEAESGGPTGHASMGGRHTECAGCREASGGWRPIGQAAIYNIDWARGTGEFGRLMIGEADAAGRGLAREATAAVVALARERLGLQEVHLEVMPGNVRAIEVYEACGFEVSGSTEQAVRMSTRNGAAPLSVVFPFFGRYERVEEGIFQRLAEMEPLGREFEFVFVFDGPFWKTLCLVQNLSERFPQAARVEIDHQTDLPAVLFNAGIRASRGPAVAFALANQPWIAANYQRLAAAVRGGGPGQAFYLSAAEMRRRFSSLPTAGLLHGWQQYGPLLPLTAVAAPQSSQAFDESPLLQTACDWDWLLRLSRDAQVQHAGELIGTASSVPLRHYPFCRDFRPSDDLQHRYVVRNKQPAQGLREDAAPPWPQASFLSDLKADDAAYLQRRAAAFDSLRGPGAGAAGDVSRPAPCPITPATKLLDTNPRKRGPLACASGWYDDLACRGHKIAITGGQWEHHHNRLGFFHYLDHLQGSGFASYKVLLDRSVTRSDLAGNDLVVLTRARCDRVRFIVDQCAALGIPTLYMIDDNWLTFAADYPKYYANLFSPGRPDYENFLYALRHATAVLTYSPILAEDIAPYARRVLRLPVSVPLAEFESVPRPPHPDHFVVGFAGSLRHEDAAFAAMAAVARKRRDVRLLLFGDLAPEQERMFDGLAPVRLPLDSYDGYIRQIRQAAPDILVAPLGNKRMEQSKCPNKYLETTAAGAAGVYSGVPPYVWHVEHGRNGILVQDSDSEAQWGGAIEGLLDRRALARIWQAARDDVGKNHDVPVVAAEFRRMILDFLASAED